MSTNDVLKFINSNPRSWTAKELAYFDGCSYSTARTQLKRLFDSGKVQRTRVSRITPGRAPREEWAYFRFVGSEIT